MLEKRWKNSEPAGSGRLRKVLAYLNASRGAEFDSIRASPVMQGLRQRVGSLRDEGMDVDVQLRADEDNAQSSRHVTGKKVLSVVVLWLFL